MEEKLRKHFDGMIVKKSNARQLFASLSLPAFIRDWFLKKYADKNGDVNVNFISDRIKEILPARGEWNRILDTIIGGEHVKFLAKIKATQDIKTGSINFALPDYAISNSNTLIEHSVWEKIKNHFLRSDDEVWGIVELGYQTAAVSAANYKSTGKKGGLLLLKGFTAFCPYTADLKYYKAVRAEFDINEWVDVLLSAADYNPAAFATTEAKITMLMRLLPFVEKRLNIIELAPKGTGKSYLFSGISKYGWLSSGGVMTRAKMFYDMNKKEAGLVSGYDYVALDEIATIKFPDIGEMQGALKGYLESGAFTVGNKAGTGSAGIVLLGNIPIESMDTDLNMFTSLPAIFAESALIDRFHGFIEGWKIPRMSESMKANGWALNTEYFSEIMHLLRSDVAATGIVNDLLVLPENADTRDVNAVKRLATAWTKLLFPHWETISDVDINLFKTYCLAPAVQARLIIKKQLCIIDKEYLNYPVPNFGIKGIL